MVASLRSLLEPLGGTLPPFMGMAEGEIKARPAVEAGLNDGKEVIRSMRDVLVADGSSFFLFD